MPTESIFSGFMPLVLALSFLSGLGSFLQGKRDGRLKGNVLDFLTEIVTAQVVGLATAYLGNAGGVEQGVTCAFVLILSNNASDTIGKLKASFITRLTGLAGSGGNKS